MAKIKDIAFGLTLGYSVLATYLVASQPYPTNTLDNQNVNQTDSLEFNNIVDESRVIGTLRYNNVRYPLFEGPLGPRLGTIDYVANNLFHHEKVLLTERVLTYFPQIASRTANDIWENKDIIIEDISSKIDQIIRGDR
jgi:hypothetical protein